MRAGPRAGLRAAGLRAARLRAARLRAARLKAARLRAVRLRAGLRAGLRAAGMVVSSRFRLAWLILSILAVEVARTIIITYYRRRQWLLLFWHVAEFLSAQRARSLSSDHFLGHVVTDTFLVKGMPATGGPRNTLARYVRIQANCAHIRYITPLRRRKCWRKRTRRSIWCRILETGSDRPR